MATSKRAKPPGREEYLIHTSQGTIRKVQVPAGSKVTLGPAIPPKHGQLTRVKEWTMRIYEGKERQIAVFTDVIQMIRADVLVDEREHYDKTTEKTEKRLRGLSNPSPYGWQELKPAKQFAKAVIEEE